jgi:signal transduction histidine kinase
MTISLLEKADRMKSAVKEAWVQYLNLSGKASERVSQKQIADALTRSFLRHGISEPFRFGVYDSLSGKFEFNADVKTKQLLGKEAYAVPLFPNDMHPGSSELRVWLEVSDSRVYRALWLELLTAFVLTSVLVLVFYFTFREALRQKKISEIRNDFINNMTHEMKTPIATISLAADTMTNPLVIADTDKVRHYAELIRRENRRMNDQVEKVLELALAERNELKMHPEPIDPGEFLAHTVATMSLQAAAKNGTIRYEVEPDLPTIQADPFHLERAFTNLIDNALKYSPQKPQVHIRASLVNGAVRVEVTDNGIGIASADQSRIFDQFYRVSTGNRHDVKGFGLGLSYVKTIVEKHGGTVSVKSQPGKGSSFTIMLPV